MEEGVKSRNRRLELPKVNWSSVRSDRRRYDRRGLDSRRDDKENISFQKKFW